MAGTGAQSQGGANAPKNARNGGEERENRADRGVSGAPTHSGVLYRTRETHRARLSASTGYGRTRRSHRWSRRGGRRPELAERGAPSVGGDGAWWSGYCCASEREGESASRGARLVAGTEADAAGRSWWPTRARPSCRMLATRRPSFAGSAWRHGAAVRTQTRRGCERGEGGERWRAGPASASGPEVRLRLASVPFPFSIFFEFLFSKHF